MTGGTAELFRLDLEDGTRLVLKSFDQQHTLLERDVFAAGLLVGLDCPVTRYLLIDASEKRLPFRFALTSYLAGEAAITFAQHPRYNSVFEQIGTLARKLHQIPLPGFGELPAPAHATNADYIRDLSNSAFERFVHYGADPALAARLRRDLDRDFDAIVPVTRQAVFAHNDLHPGNILVVDTANRLAISGLIDFGNARASSAVMDLAKTIFCCEHMAPGCAEPILSGYGSVDHPHPAEALAFYTTLHRLTMWSWLRYIGVIAAPDAPSDIMDALRKTARQS